MKIYSWKTLLVTTFMGGGYFIYKILHFKGYMDFLWLIFFAYILLKGICVSISKEEYEADVKKAATGKRVCRKLFGKFATLAPYGALVFMLLSWVVAKTEPTWEWLILTLILSALVYNIWLSLILKKHMKIEEEQERANHDRIE